MEHTRRTPAGKPYDIRERLFLFARDVVAAAQKLQTRGAVADSLSRHLAEAVVSAAANAEEADDASSNKDFRAKQRICLRELKETRLRLRVLHATGGLEEDGQPLVDEASALIRIVSTIIRNNERNDSARE